MLKLIASAALVLALAAAPAVAGDNITVNGDNNTVIKVDGGVIVNDTFYRVSDGEPVDIVNVDGGILVNGKFYRDVEASDESYEDEYGDDYDDYGGYDVAEVPPPPAVWAVACVTPVGNFPLVQALPLGAPCFGLTAFGPATGWSGFPNDRYY